MKRIGVREIARAAKVSIGTVDRALNNRKEISNRTRDRILKVARELGYVPDAAARALSISRTTLKIGVCIPKEIRYFYDPLWNGIQEEVQRYRHARIELLYRPVKALESDQTKAIRSLLSENINGLIVTPGNPVALARHIDSAELEHDVRVVCVATDDSISRRSCTVSVNPRMNGMLAADLMAHFVPACSKVGIVTGSLSTEDHARKISGFSESFPAGCTGGVILPIIEGHEDESATLAECRELLRRHPDIAGIYVSTVNCIPVCQALLAEQLAGRVKLITTDLFPEAVPFVMNRTISAVIHQQPRRQGQASIRLLLEHLLNRQPLPSAEYLNPEIVMRANLSLFPEAKGAEATAASR
jgi:LacI family transcriptional regulator